MEGCRNINRYQNFCPLPAQEKSSICQAILSSRARPLLVTCTAAKPNIVICKVNRKFARKHESNSFQPAKEHFSENLTIHLPHLFLRLHHRETNPRCIASKQVDVSPTPLHTHYPPAVCTAFSKPRVLPIHPIVPAH